MRDAEYRRFSLAKRTHEQVHVVLGDAPERRARLAPVPRRRGISQAEQRKRGHAGVEVAAELAGIDRLLDDALDKALVLELQRADALARRLRKEAPLAQEDQREVVALRQRRKMVEDKLGYFVGTALRAAQDALRMQGVVLHAFGANRLERGFLRFEIVVETRLPDAQHVCNILRGGAVVAAPGEYLRRGGDDLGVPLLRLFAGARVRSSCHAYNSIAQ